MTVSCRGVLVLFSRISLVPIVVVVVVVFFLNYCKVSSSIIIYILTIQGSLLYIFLVVVVGIAISSEGFMMSLLVRCCVAVLLL